MEGRLWVTADVLSFFFFFLQDRLFCWIKVCLIISKWFFWGIQTAAEGLCISVLSSYSALSSVTETQQDVDLYVVSHNVRSRQLLSVFTFVETQRQTSMINVKSYLFGVFISLDLYNGAEEC